MARSTVLNQFCFAPEAAGVEDVAVSGNFIKLAPAIASADT